MWRNVNWNYHSSEGISKTDQFRPASLLQAKSHAANSCLWTTLICIIFNLYQSLRNTNRSKCTTSLGNSRATFTSLMSSLNHAWVSTVGSKSEVASPFVSASVKSWFSIRLELKKFSKSSSTMSGISVVDDSVVWRSGSWKITQGHTDHVKIVLLNFKLFPKIICCCFGFIFFISKIVHGQNIYLS